MCMDYEMSYFDFESVYDKDNLDKNQVLELINKALVEAEEYDKLEDLVIELDSTLTKFIIEEIKGEDEDYEDLSM